LLFGSVSYEEIEITFIQQPFADDENYRAQGIGSDGIDYCITWPITNHECEDESEACDWNDFRVRQV
jgi:hypothetical protein